MAPRAPRKVAVTGGAQGIGKAVAEQLVAHGSRVVIGDIAVEQAVSTAREIGGGTHALPLDVADAESFSRFLDIAEDTLDGLDVLVNNAGIMAVGPFLEENERVTERTLDVDLRGVITGTRLAGQRFQAQGHGHVVNVASALGTIASSNVATYCAAKYGVVGLGDALRLEWHGTGLKISSICPGFVRTDLIAGLPSNPAMERLLMADPEQVADAICAVIAKDRSTKVFVPRLVGTSTQLNRAFPLRVQDWLFRVTGGGRVTAEVDREQRAPYERRATGVGS